MNTLELQSFSPYKIIPDTIEQIRKANLQHVAVIMDGNGRWANEKNLPRTQGHVAGEEALMRVISAAIVADIKCLSVYAFSTENWKRSPAEVKFLMGYSRNVLRKRCDQLNEWNVKIVWSGRKHRLWKSVINELERAEKLTENNTGLVLNMCINYGGRLEITDALYDIVKNVENGKISSESIDQNTISSYLYNPQLPDVDLMIRTSGEKRISNFLLWQCAYAEFEFLDTYWPDMDQNAFYKCIENFTSRHRRFGAAVDKVKAQNTQ